MKSKATKAIALIKEAKLPSSHQNNVLEFLRLQPCEVFSNEEQDNIAQDPGMNANNVDWYLRALEKKHNSL